MQCDYFLPSLWVEAILKLDHLLLGSLPCIICLRCLKDTCIPEDALLKDPRRLYAPGRIYHIVERKSFRYPLFLINGGNGRGSHKFQK